VIEDTIADQSELATRLLRVAQRCAACATGNDFATLVRDDVRRLLPHSSLVAVLWRIDLEHLELIHVEAVDYPAHLLTALQPLTNLRNRPALVRWLSSRAPMVLDSELDGRCLSETERDEIQHLRVGRVAVHGVFDMGARSGSHFSFGGLPRALDHRNASRLLQLLVPHLHQGLTLCHQMTASSAPPGTRLTEAEREIMRWVAAGRTNAEIAHLRGRSEATIRNQLTATFRKLGVSNRAAAVRFYPDWA
jgi:DNA-binding CsgD family transcriptional regulator